MINPKDCCMLTKECYIKCDQLFSVPIKNFKIIKSEQLSSEVLIRLIQKVKLSPTLTGIQIKKIVLELENCLKVRNYKIKI